MLALASSGVLLSAAGMVAVLYAQMKRGWGSAGPASDPKQLLPVALTSCGWAALYYAFLFSQSAATFYTFLEGRKKKKSGDDGKAPSFGEVKYGGKGTKLNLSMNRTVGNFIEQSIVFLAALWMHAIFVDVQTAVKVGWTWIAIRSIYPLVFYIGGFSVFLCTIPAYVCVWYLLGCVVMLAFYRF